MNQDMPGNKPKVGHRPGIRRRARPLPAAFFTPWGEGRGEGQKRVRALRKPRSAGPTEAIGLYVCARICPSPQPSPHREERWGEGGARACRRRAKDAMTMISITLEKAQQDLPALVQRVLAGEEIVLGAPGAVVKLTAVAAEFVNAGLEPAQELSRTRRSQRPTSGRAGIFRTAERPGMRSRRRTLLRHEVPARHRWYFGGRGQSIGAGVLASPLESTRPTPRNPGLPPA